MWAGFAAPDDASGFGDAEIDPAEVEEVVNGVEEELDAV